jgi:hypothetical protein
MRLSTLAGSKAGGRAEPELGVVIAESWRKE